MGVPFVDVDFAFVCIARISRTVVIARCLSHGYFGVEESLGDVGMESDPHFSIVELVSLPGDHAAGIDDDIGSVFDDHIDGFDDFGIVLIGTVATIHIADNRQS